MHTDGLAAFIIEIDQKIIAPRLADDLRAVQGVNVVDTVYDLVRANAVGVVSSCPPPAEQNALRAYMGFISRLIAPSQYRGSP